MTIITVAFGRTEIKKAIQFAHGLPKVVLPEGYPNISSQITDAAAAAYITEELVAWLSESDKRISFFDISSKKNVSMSNCSIEIYGGILRTFLFYQKKEWIGMQVDFNHESLAVEFKLRFSDSYDLRVVESS